MSVKKWILIRQTVWLIFGEQPVCPIKHGLYTTLKQLSAEFRRGRDSIQDDACTERPAAAMNQETSATNRELVMADQWLSGT